MTGLDFTVTDFALSGVDAQGVKWTTTAVRGWHGGPPMRSDRQAKSQRAGSWPSQGHSGERIVTLTGVARADNTAAIEAALMRSPSQAPVAGSSACAGQKRRISTPSTCTVRPDTACWYAVPRATSRSRRR